MEGYDRDSNYGGSWSERNQTTQNRVMEPKPEITTEGYSLEATYGSGRLDGSSHGSGHGRTEPDQENSEDTSGYVRPGRTGGYGRPSKLSGAGTSDEPDPEAPTEGYSLENTYGSSKVNQYTSGGNDGYGGRKPGGYGDRPHQKIAGSGSMDEPDQSVAPTAGYSLENTYGKVKIAADDAEAGGYGGKTSSYGQESEDQAGGYGRVPLTKPTGHGTWDEPDLAVPTAGYLLESTYGKPEVEGDHEGSGYGGRKPGRFGGAHGGYRQNNDEDDESEGRQRRTDESEDGKSRRGHKKYSEEEEEEDIRRPRRQDSDDSDVEEKNKHRKHGHKYGGGGNQQDGYGRSKYGSSEDEELASAADGLSLDSNYKRRDSDYPGDANSRPTHGQRYRKPDNDYEE